MPFPPRYAALIDGAFVIRKLESRLGRFPTAQDIQLVATSIAKHECVAGLSRLRTYFYHARPADQQLINPISKEQISLGKTEVFANHTRLLRELELLPDLALRLGETDTVGWRVGDSAFQSIVRTPRLLQAQDLVPVITQKGVDLRIGLDIAKFALTQSVEAIVTITGDSDLVPAFRFARREGVRVFLCYLGHGVKRELRAHADRSIRIALPTPPMRYRVVEEAA